MLLQKLFHPIVHTGDWHKSLPVLQKVISRVSFAKSANFSFSAQFLILKKKSIVKKRSCNFLIQNIRYNYLQNYLDKSLFILKGVKFVWQIHCT